MRAALLVLLLALVSALSLSSPVHSVSVPFSVCSSSVKYHFNLSTLTADAWPPKKGGHVNVTVNGTLNEAVTGGSYQAKVTYLGLPISTMSGNLSDFKPLPWAVGPLDFSYSEAIPDGAPSGKSTQHSIQRRWMCG